MRLTSPGELGVDAFFCAFATTDELAGASLVPVGRSATADG